MGSLALLLGLTLDSANGPHSQETSWCAKREGSVISPGLSIPVALWFLLPKATASGRQPFVS